MRLLKIFVEVFEIEENESDDEINNLLGIEAPVDIEPSRAECYIDLDRVSSVWVNPEGDLCIHLGTTDESYWTNSFTINEFVALWKQQ
jgi:hypothetical protein